MTREALSPVKQALIAMKQMQAELDAMAREKTEPIAIIGIGCRFPGGASTPESFWSNLERRVDGVVQIPAERLRMHPSGEALVSGDGARPVRWAAILNDIDRFDPQFFGISPREATRLDPQQRLVLEVVWEALEHAGQVPDQLAGSRTGVFIGITNDEYRDHCRSIPEDQQDYYSLTGHGHCFSAGRVSYVLGFEGPSLAVDTACSSSLVAIHLACQSLRSGDSTLALAGGVSVVLEQPSEDVLARMQVLSPDGRCKTFDAQANGFVRGEGCAFVVLKRLSDAQRDGDRILSLIRGSAVNQDGRSSGLTAPNVRAQKEMLRRALDVAGVAPEDIGYVETHGTGTPLGDPIEVEALADVLGATRADGSICVLGALKTNIGHLEAAAGVASVIKVALCMQHEAIPPNLHFRALNPRISLDGTRFVLPTSVLPWKAGAKPRRAGVSSFGMSGTNAHLVMEEAPRAEGEPHAEQPSLFVLPLSARAGEALTPLAEGYRRLLAGPPEQAGRLMDIAYTASMRRSHHEHRLAVVGRSREELSASLEAFVRGEARAGLVQDRAAAGSRPKLVLVFSGQGAQWPGMGRALLEKEPVFRDAIEACDRAIQRIAGFSVKAALTAPVDASRLNETLVAQPALFALQVALAELWRSWGIRPDAVIGHSVGEVAAARVAGALDLDEAARLVVLRGRVMQKATGLGKMAAVALSPQEAAVALTGREDRLAIAAINDPGSVVLAGDEAALSSLLAELQRADVHGRMLRVDYAFHSPQMDPLAAELAAALGPIEARRAEIPMYSTGTGSLLANEARDAAYWAQNIRARVKFAQAVDAAIADGHRLFLEVGPHPALLDNVQQCLAARRERGHALGSLRRGQDEQRSLLETLAALYVRGCPIAWKALAQPGARCVSLPSYPWQRQRYWLDAPTRAKSSPALSVSRESGGHPLLGGAPLVSSTQPRTYFWQQPLSVKRLAYLADHRVHDDVVVPGAAYVEMALAAAAQVFGEKAFAVERLVFERMLLLSPDEERLVQVVLSLEGDELASFHLASRPAADTTWTRHASGTVRVGAAAREPLPPAETQIAMVSRSAAQIAAAELYQGLAAGGLTYGASFRGVEQLWVGTGDVLGRVRVPEGLSTQIGDYRIHPAVLDACFHVLAGLVSTHSSEGAYVPVGIERVELWGRPGRVVWAQSWMRGGAIDGADLLKGDVRLLSDKGEVVGEVRGLSVARLEGASSPRASLSRWLYALEWQRREPGSTPAPSAVEAGAWLLLVDRGGTGAALAASLSARGERCVRVFAGKRFARIEPSACDDLDPACCGVDSTCFEVDPAEPADIAAVLEQAFGREMPCRGAVHLWSLDATSTPQTTLETLSSDQEIGGQSALWLAQALVKKTQRSAARLWLVTRGAQSLGGEAAIAVAQAPVWGLGRTLALEHPELRCARVDLDPSSTPEDATALLRELFASDGEDQIALRGGGRYVARLVRRSLGAVARSEQGGAIEGANGEASSRPSPVRADGTYLISGGLGGLGLSVARWMVAQGARHLALLGRSGASSEAARAGIAALRHAGAEVLVLEADVARPADVRAALGAMRERLPELRGVIHAAGVLDDGTVLELDAARYREVMAPKMLGAWNLHELTRDAPLDFFVLYSSAASLLGSPGQANYAAANAFLDSLAHHRRAAGLPATSINWGAFAQVGMAARQDRTTSLASRGVVGLTLAEGHAILGELLVGQPAQIGAIRANQGDWRKLYPGGTIPPLLSGLVAADDGATPGAAAQAPRLRDALLRVGAEDRPKIMEDVICDKLGAVLHMDPKNVDRRRMLTSFGIDSLTGLELRNQLDAELGLRLSPTYLFKYPTISALASFLAEAWTRSALPPSSAADGRPPVGASPGVV